MTDAARLNAEIAADLAAVIATRATTECVLMYDLSPLSDAQVDKVHFPGRTRNCRLVLAVPLHYRFFNVRDAVRALTDGGLVRLAVHAEDFKRIVTDLFRLSKDSHWYDKRLMHVSTSRLLYEVGVG